MIDLEAEHTRAHAEWQIEDGLPIQPPGGVVLVRGRRAPIVGTRATEHTIIDVTDIPGVVPGDEVVIVGRQGEEAIDGAEAVRRYAMPMIELLPRMYTADQRRNPAFAAVFDTMFAAGYRCQAVGAGIDVGSSEVLRWAALEERPPTANFLFSC